MIAAAKPQPIPDTVKELFEFLVSAVRAETLGVLSAIDKTTGQQRWVLGAGSPYGFIPMGYLSTTTGDEVFPPGLPQPTVIDLLPESYDAFLLAVEVELARWADDGGPVYG